MSDFSKFIFHKDPKLEISPSVQSILTRRSRKILNHDKQTNCFCTRKLKQGMHCVILQNENPYKFDVFVVSPGDMSFDCHVMKQSALMTILPFHPNSYITKFKIYWMSNL